MTNLELLELKESLIEIHNKHLPHKLHLLQSRLDAIQEQYEIIKDQEKEIKELRNKLNR